MQREIAIGCDRAKILCLPVRNLERGGVRVASSQTDKTLTQFRQRHVKLS